MPDSQTKPSSYDTMPYPPYSFPATHPGKLAAIGRLFQLDTPDPAKARILELGCGPGMNSLAMAQIFPEAEVIGVDNSSKQIAQANETLAATGLGNARFIESDIAALPDDLGTFDFIITHGIYSWVPEGVKDAILRISSANLSPNGIAYVSYNCLPGWRMRGALRDMMLMHTAGIEDAAGKVAQAKALIKFLAESCSEETPYGKYLRQELEMLTKVDDSYIAHEFLESENEALYFTDFLKAAAKHRLAYLGDADPSTMIVDNMPEQAAKTLKSLNLNLLATEQYMDFVRNRTFRSTLLCHASAKLSRNVDPASLMELRVHPLVVVKRPWSAEEPAIFGTSAGAELTVSEEITASVLSAAVAGDPSSLVSDVLESVEGRFRERFESKDPAAVRADLGRILLQGFFKRMVDFTMGSPSRRFASAASDLPEVLPLARWQASHGQRLSSPRLEMLTADPFVARFVALCDGTRDRASLIEAMVEAHSNKQYQLNENNQPVTDAGRAKDIIEKLHDGTVSNLRRLGLLLPEAA
jgi:methyltransferase-like protein/2-polyprenyl-3-methyl-5-hydroxy-6-metoxy-1,4-benzoquinol methylase